MTAKTRATKPQPKPLDPLEEMVRKQIDLEDAVARVAMEDSQRSTLSTRIAARLAKAHAAIKAEAAPSDPLAGVPEADSGEALVGRWCVAWDDGGEDEPVIGRVTRHDPDDADNSYRVGVNEYWRQHASPIERGIPEAVRKAVEG